MVDRLGSRDGSWQRKIWEDLARVIADSGGVIKVQAVNEDGEAVELSLPDLKMIELQLDILTELRKMNFLLERISGVDVEAEAFDGRN